MKAVVAACNQEKALVGAFSVITNLRLELFEALPEEVPHKLDDGALPPRPVVVLIVLALLEQLEPGQPGNPELK